MLASRTSSLAFFYATCILTVLTDEVSLCRQKDFNNAVFDERTVILCDQVCYAFPFSAVA
jgi:hypothetical protein